MEILKTLTIAKFCQKADKFSFYKVCTNNKVTMVIFSVAGGKAFFDMALEHFALRKRP